MALRPPSLNARCISKMVSMFSALRAASGDPPGFPEYPGANLPLMRPLAEPHSAATNWPKGSAIAPTIVRRQVGSMDSYDAALNMLNERDHGWQVSSNLSVPALGCPAQGGRWRDGDASAREIARHRALQRVEGAVPDVARLRDLALVVIMGRRLCDGVPGLRLAV